ncbi:MAG: alpha/beta fold hydrolase [Anaerolineales bacterium]
MKPRTAALLTATAIAGVAGAQLWSRYTRYRRLATAHLNAGSQVVQTRCGPMEYAIAGEGPLLMFVHGALGGYDQSLTLARLIHGFTIIAPSRPGHLRTPLTTGRSPAEQADAYAALLDVLGIPRIAVVGGSGGGPSALQFALRHADRCWALVMVSAVCLRPPPSTMRRYHFWARLAPFDFAMWALEYLMVEALLQASGVTPETRRRLATELETMDILTQVMQLYPTHSRAAGLLNDLAEAERVLPVTGLESIALPTLVIHGTVDSIVPFENAKHVASRIPRATLLPIEGGGHLCIATHRAEAIPVMTHFLHQHAPQETYAHHRH